MSANQPTLLLVDDKWENLFALEQILEDEGYTLLQAQSGHEALRQVLHHDIDLVLLDVQMPEMDGFQVAELLRRAQKTRDIPIIFITAISREYQFREKGYDLGASSYLMKPIDPDELRKKIAYALKLRKLSLMTKNLK